MHWGIKHIVWPAVVLVLAMIAVVVLVFSRPAIDRADDAERVWPVSATAVTVGDVTPELRLFGQIVAGAEVDLRALVSGEVVAVGAQAFAGGKVKKGALIAAIDDFDYRASVDEQKAQIREAEAKLQELEANRTAAKTSLAEEREMLRLRGRDEDRARKLSKRGNISDRSLDDSRTELARQRKSVALRTAELKGVVARIQQQRAVLERLKIGLRRAERDLERTRLIAPFDGFITDMTAQIGKRLGASDRVAGVIDVARLEVRTTVSDAQYGRLLTGGDLKGRPATVLWHAGAKVMSFKARLDRIGGVIETASGGIDIFARLQDQDLDAALRAGAFVELRTADQTFSDVARLPEAALIGGVQVFVIEQDRIAVRKVELVARIGNDVLLRGDFKLGEMVITTQHAELGPGLKAEAREAK
jgi:RND family efflux transporter MFP subunit